MTVTGNRNLMGYVHRPGKPGRCLREMGTVNLNPALPGTTYNSEGTSWQPADIGSIGHDPGKEHSRRPGYDRRYEGS